MVDKRTRFGTARPPRPEGGVVGHAHHLASLGSGGYRAEIQSGGIAETQLDFLGAAKEATGFGRGSS